MSLFSSNSQAPVRRDNFVLLLIALIFLLLLQGLSAQFFDESGQRWAQAVIIISLAAIIWGVQANKRWLKRTLFFLLSVFIITILTAVIDSFSLGSIQLLLLFVFLLQAVIRVGRQILLTSETDANRIAGSVCLYILLALCWSCLYGLSYIHFADSFTTVSDLQWHQMTSTFNYFSFVTITTLGFGDISPTLPITEFLVFMEALVGQFYLAILVASLVGARLSQVDTIKKTDQ